MHVTIFQPEGFCAKCKATKLQFDKYGIEYETVIATEEIILQLKKDGHSVFPVVVVKFSDDVTWSWNDLRIDRIHELAQLAA